MSTEHISNIFILILLLFTLNIVAENTINSYISIWAGIAIGLGFNTRQTVVIYALIPLIAILISKNINTGEKIKYYIFILLGIFIAFIFTTTFLYLFGDFKGYIYTVFTYPKLYSSMVSKVDLIEFMENKFVIILCLLTFLSLFTKYWHICLLAFIVGVVCYFLPLKGYSHYIVNLMPVVCFQVLILMRKNQESRLLEYRILLFISIYLLFFASYIVFNVNFSRKLLPYKIQTFAPLVKHVNEKYINKKSIFIFGQPILASYLNYAIDIKPVNTYFYCLQLDPYWSNVLPKRIDYVLNEYLKYPPAIMIVSWKEVHQGPTDNAHKLVRELLQAHNYLSKERFGTWQIYELTATHSNVIIDP